MSERKETNKKSNLIVGVWERIGKDAGFMKTAFHGT